MFKSEIMKINVHLIKKKKKKKYDKRLLKYLSLHDIYGDTASQNINLEKKNNLSN